MSDLLNSASLVMIPSGYKEDVVYSQIPTDGSGDLSFTRASNGTRINSAGLVEVAPWNLLQYSQEIGNGIAWQSLNAIVITPNSTTAPDGTMTADTLLDVGGASIVRQFDYSVVAGQTYTFSVYLKKATGSPLTRLRIEQDQSPYNNSYIDITPTNEWVRYSVTRTIEAGITSVNYGIFPDINNGDSVYAWGAQLNIGSTAKPYFPTTDRLNVPRLTYQNGGGGCPSLLLEKQSTNYARNWNFTAATWSTNAILRTANAGISPDGTNNAYLIYPSPSGTDRFIYDDQGSAGYSANTNYTTTVYAKAAGLNWAYIRFEDKSNITSYVYFNLATGVVGSTTGSVTIISKTIESVGNGWYRLRVTANMGTGSAGNNNVLFGVADGDASTYATASGTNGVLFYGPQSERSDYPTSPITTSGSSATRVADACYKTGISSLIGQTEGVLFCQFNKPVDTLQNLRLNVSDGSFNNWVFVGFESTSLRAYLRANNTVIETQTFSTTANINKIAIAYKSGNYAIYHNGTQISSGTTVYSFSATLSQLNFGETPTDFNIYPIAQIAQFELFKTRLTNAELASLTTL